MRNQEFRFQILSSNHSKKFIFLSLTIQLYFIFQNTLFLSSYPIKKLNKQNKQLYHILFYEENHYIFFLTEILFHIFLFTVY